MADISKITLPSGNTYNIKDVTARELIKELQNYSDFLGITTTELVDGANTNPIIIENKSVTAKKGNVVIYGNKEFIFNGTVWQEFGDLSVLGTLAFKNKAEGSYTPAGTVSTPTFTGTAESISASFIPAGDVDITTDVMAPVINYTPAGIISTPTITVTPNTTTVNSITDVGSLPTCTLPNMTATVTDENLTLGWSAGSFDAGTLPSQGANTTVVTGIKSASSSQLDFTGTGVKIQATFTGAVGTATGTFTPSGDISQPNFTGTAATIEVS